MGKRIKRIPLLSIMLFMEFKGEKKGKLEDDEGEVEILEKKKNEKKGEKGLFILENEDVRDKLVRA
jgi:hypothetical protein